MERTVEITQKELENLLNIAYDSGFKTAENLYSNIANNIDNISSIINNISLNNTTGSLPPYMLQYNALSEMGLKSRLERLKYEQLKDLIPAIMLDEHYSKNVGVEDYNYIMYNYKNNLDKESMMYRNSIIIIIQKFLLTAAHHSKKKMISLNIDQYNKMIDMMKNELYFIFDKYKDYFKLPYLEDYYIEIENTLNDNNEKMKVLNPEVFKYILRFYNISLYYENRPAVNYIIMPFSDFISIDRESII